jgi:cytidylate kinase
MGYRAIALSLVDGSGGESIGKEVAGRLGFGYLNETVVAQVAAEQGLGTATVADAERRRSFVERLANATALAGVEGIALDASYFAADRSDAILGLIRDAVRNAAGHGDVVLVGHAASYACADLPGVLRICITAPLQTRVTRVAAAQGIGEKDAVKLLRQSDAGRMAYLKRVYGADGESPTDYDLVLNTDRLGSGAAIEAVLALARTANHQH